MLIGQKSEKLVSHFYLSQTCCLFHVQVGMNAFHLTKHIQCKWQKHGVCELLLSPWEYKIIQDQVQWLGRENQSTVCGTFWAPLCSLDSLGCAVIQNGYSPGRDCSDCSHEKGPHNVAFPGSLRIVHPIFKIYIYIFSN